MTIFDGSPLVTTRSQTTFTGALRAAAPVVSPLTDVALNTKLMTKRQLISTNTLRLCALRSAFARQKQPTLMRELAVKKLSLCMDIGDSKGRGGLRRLNSILILVEEDSSQARSCCTCCSPSCPWPKVTEAPARAGANLHAGQPLFTPGTRANSLCFCAQYLWGG